MKRILIVEDEPAVSDVIEFALRRAGFESVTVSSDGAARRCFDEQRFEAVVLDLGLPDGDGTDLCRWLRAHSEPELRSLPVIMVTCRDEETDRVLGLELGADDYVVKPFSPRELVARLSSVLRRVHHRFGQPRESVSLGPLRLDRNAFEVTIGGQIVGLTKTEFEILWVMARAPQRVFSRALLVQQAYDGAVVSDRTVDSHIKSIRQKCAARSPGWDPIQTIYGVGYRASRA